MREEHSGNECGRILVTVLRISYCRTRIQPLRLLTMSDLKLIRGESTMEMSVAGYDSMTVLRVS